MGSFKAKLVAYFLLLALLPLTAAFWGFTSVAGQSATHRVDARLQEGLQAALASYQERIDRAQLEATALARSPAFQRGLERRDLRAVARLLRPTGDVSVTAAGGFAVGARPAFAATREVAVVTSRGFAGTVTAAVPFDAALLASLRTGSGLARADALVILQGTRIVAASPALGGTVDGVRAGRTSTVSVGGARFRLLASPAVAGLPGVRFAVLSPQSLVDAANLSSRNEFLLGLLVSVLLVSVVAYFEGRSIVRTLRGLADAAHAIARGRLAERVPVRGRDEFAALGSAFNEMADQLQARLAELEEERLRLRAAIDRFGEALAATHDTGTLLRVIVETAVEATGAHGARLVAVDGRRVETGRLDAEGEELELPLVAGRTTFGTLALAGPSFGPEQRLTASSLASHAAIALENARLHHVAERQALVDDVTGIANRRHCEDALAREIARSERLGSALTIAFADLDDFKAVNDRHGHSVGDDVLRTFASVLEGTLRESDLPGRWGGEEFLLLLPGTDLAGGAELAERVRSALAERTFEGREGDAVTVTCSVGVAQHRPGGDAQELFAAADRALYLAKRAGKDRVEPAPAVRSF